jgi:putative transposase
MGAKQHHVRLTSQEQQVLGQMLRRGKHSARELTRVRILLKADEGLRDEDIAEAVETSVATIERVRKRFGTVRLGTLTERPRQGRRPILEAKGEARLIAEACSTAPGGRERWTLQLLADRVVELELAEQCSKDTVRRVLKKIPLSPGSSRSGAFLR